jgi:predicted enzyme related to lactoylglutathione lyase
MGTPKVTGIGGIFFKVEDPDKTKAWYAEHLGLAVNPWGSSFESRNANDPAQINYLQWSPMKPGGPPMDDDGPDFMINYRVQHIEALVAQLLEAGVEVCDDIESYEYGKFVHIKDPFGNKIELWEPVDAVFTAMGLETTK